VASKSKRKINTTGIFHRQIYLRTPTSSNCIKRYLYFSIITQCACNEKISFALEVSFQKIKNVNSIKSSKGIRSKIKIYERKKQEPKKKRNSI
jgi:hypothetical protein